MAGVQVGGASTAMTSRDKRISQFSGPLGGYLETSRRIGVRPDSVQVFGGTLSLAAAHHLLVWLTFGLRSAEHRGEAWLKRGLPSSK